MITLSSMMTTMKSKLENFVVQYRNFKLIKTITLFPGKEKTVASRA